MTQIKTEKFKYLETIILEFEKLVETIDSDFPHPKLIKHGDRYALRHAQQERSDTLASYLKLIRIISILKSCLCLIHHGYIQEVYILCRAIDEAEEDISFFALSSKKPEINKNQMRLLKEFYQEEHNNPNDPFSNSKRDRVPRRKIRSAITSIPTKIKDHNTFLKAAKSIYSTLSGYVHGSYPAIIEMYNPSKQKYQMCGMPNSSRAFECIDNLTNHIYRSISALEALSYRIQRQDIAKSAQQLNCNLAENTDCLGTEGINP